MAKRGMSEEERRTFALWLRQRIAHQVGGVAAELQRRTKDPGTNLAQLSITTCERLLRATETTVDLATIFRLVESGLLSGADLEEYARGRRPAVTPARDAAAALYNALVEEVVGAPEGELIRLKVNDPDPAKRREEICKRLAFTAPHLEGMERAFFRRTLEMRVQDRDNPNTVPAVPLEPYNTVGPYQAPVLMPDWTPDLEAAGKIGRKGE